MDNLLEQVKEALEKATPGKWEVNDFDMMYSAEIISEHPKDVFNAIAQGIYVPDAELIANSPTWLKQLIEMIEGLQRENEQRKEEALSWRRLLENESHKLKIAEEPLEWYAKQGNYAERRVNAEFGFYDIEKPMVLTDHGRKAGEALSRMRAEE